MRLIAAARLSVLVRAKPGDKLSEDDKLTEQTGLDSQERGIIAWANANGHTIVEIVKDFRTGKSNLWDRPNLRPWVTESSRMKEYDGIVALKMDRLTRADNAGVNALEKWADDNGKQLFITEASVHFPAEGVDGIAWDLYTRMAHAEYLNFRERYMRMQGLRHDDGSAVGRPPWGYEIVRIDGIKEFEPTPEGRIWVPRIFGWLAEGETPRDVGRRLEEAGVMSLAPGGRWHESRVISMARTPTYAGTRIRNGRAPLQVEPLVSHALMEQAQAKLSSRARPGRGTSTLQKALLKPTCGHPDCPGEGTWPMYRVGGNGPKRKDGTRRFQPYSYRCTGRGAQRQGCGNPMVDLATLDNMVLGWSELWDNTEYVSQRYVSGNDAGARLELLRAEMREALSAGDLDPDRIPEVAADYAARIKALEAEDAIKPHWEDVHTGMTEGDYLRGLDLDGQRDYLARKDIRAWRVEDSIYCTIDGRLVRRTFGGLTAVMEAAERYADES